MGNKLGLTDWNKLGFSATFTRFEKGQARLKLEIEFDGDDSRMKLGNEVRCVTGNLFFQSWV